MILSKFAGYQGSSMEIRISYDIENMDIKEVRHILVCDVYEGAYVNIAELLFEKFPSIFHFIVHSINWEEVYQEHLKASN